MPLYPWYAISLDRPRFQTFGKLFAVDAAMMDGCYSSESKGRRAVTAVEVDSSLVA
jgi:hypothetical protein